MRTSGKEMAMALVGVISLLFMANVIANYVRRAEPSAIPESFVGQWLSWDGETLLSIRPRSLSLAFEGTTRRCVMEEAVIYWEGAPFAYLFGEPHLAIVCDKRSTDVDQERFGLAAPQDYRKTYYLSQPDFQGGSIEVDATFFASQGWEESKGVYRWAQGRFFPASR